MDKLSTLRSWIAESKKIVFFGGAGVSTESGIPDFRSVDGLYHQKFDYPPETILSHSFFFSHTDDFYKFYREKMLVTDIEPNRAHVALAKLEQQGKLSAVVTQNIDGLHQKAGSRKVYELHGSVHRNYCRKCRKFYSGEALLQTAGVPKCTCGGTIKPDVVLYEESLDEDCIMGAVRAIADLYDEMNLRLALAAPTGRAAQRLSELTGREAVTIHRLLGASAAGSGNARNRHREIRVQSPPRAFGHRRRAL